VSKVIPDAKFVLFKFTCRQLFDVKFQMSFCTSKAWLSNKVKFVCQEPSNAAFVPSHEWENKCEQKPSGLKRHSCDTPCAIHLLFIINVFKSLQKKRDESNDLAAFMFVFPHGLVQKEQTCWKSLVHC